MIYLYKLKNGLHESLCKPFFCDHIFLLPILANSIGQIKGSSMVCPWFVHGSSIEKAKSVDKPWSNHGRTMEEVPFNTVLIMWNF
jgi:hypothetical protein